MSNKKAMLIDVSRCIGCNVCQDACQAENGLPEDLPDDRKDRLSDVAFTALKKYDDDVYVRQLCRHCHEPACLSVCLVDAFHKTPEGAVLYRVENCIGCRYCMQACPFFVPTYNWQHVYPKIIKCTLCSGRISEGKPTACAEACEELGIDATIFGDYDDIVIEAKRRISEDPDTYVQKIYGLTEVGGTTVLYVSAIPFEELGFDTKLQTEPMPQLTWNALSKVPNVIAVGSAMLGGIWWITNRRHEVQKHEAVKRDDKQS